MKQSESIFFQIRGLRLHCRCWGDERDPMLFMLHGWMDVSASFQFIVDELRGDWRVVAPDWRGYGLSQWGGTDSYWFPDYFADLDQLLDRLAPQQPVRLVGHSMGGNIAAIYAGVRPGRVERLVCMEGFGLRRTSPDDAPDRYARWLRELCQPARFRDYASFEELARRLREGNARLTPERADFLARHWGRESDEGRVALRGDPVHKRVNPVLYRIDESLACWRRVEIPTLWLLGGNSDFRTAGSISDEDYAERRACFGKLREVVVDDAGHMLHHDQPGRVARAIEGFLG